MYQFLANTTANFKEWCYGTNKTTILPLDREYADRQESNHYELNSSWRLLKLLGLIPLGITGFFASSLGLSWVRTTANKTFSSKTGGENSLDVYGSGAFERNYLAIKSTVPSGSHSKDVTARTLSTVTTTTDLHLNFPGDAKSNPMAMQLENPVSKRSIQEETGSNNNTFFHYKIGPEILISSPGYSPTVNHVKDKMLLYTWSEGTTPRYMFGRYFNYNTTTTSLTPVGEKFEIESYTSALPAIGVSPSRSQMIMFSKCDANNCWVYYSCYDVNGNKINGPFMLSNDTVRVVVYPYHPHLSVTISAKDNLAMPVWQSNGGGRADGYYTTFLDSDLCPQTDDKDSFQISTQMTDSPCPTRSLKDGGYIVFYPSISAQYLDDAGTKLDSPFNVYTRSGVTRKGNVAVSSLPGGGAAFIWADPGSGSVGSDVYVRCLDAQKKFTSDVEIRVNVNTTADQQYVNIIAAKKELLAAWQGYQEGAWNLYIRVLDLTCHPLSDEMKVNSKANGLFGDFTLSALDGDDGFALAWEDNAFPWDGYSVLLINLEQKNQTSNHHHFPMEWLIAFVGSSVALMLPLSCALSLIACCQLKKTKPENIKNITKNKLGTSLYHANSESQTNGSQNQETPQGTYIEDLRKSFSEKSLISLNDIVFGKNLGNGASAIVFEATWRNSKVACKLFKNAFLALDKDKEEYDLFEKEAKTLSELDHPNIVQRFGFCIEQNRIGIVMELLVCSLEDLLYTKKIDGKEIAITSDLKLGFMREIAAGLSYLHGKDILHRDLKSENILITKDLRAKLTDFGLSRLITNKTVTSYAGTPQYMSPSYAQDGHYEKSDDGYSLMVVYWQIFNDGKKPFKDKKCNVLNIPLLIAGGTLKPLTFSEENTPKSFIKFFNPGLSPKRKDRPSLAKIIEFLDDKENQKALNIFFEKAWQERRIGDSHPKNDTEVVKHEANFKS